jgi:hypothetical protein
MTRMIYLIYAKANSNSFVSVFFFDSSLT